MGESKGWRLERYQALLRLQFRQVQLDPRLRRRFDESDLVQEALLRAHQNLADFRGENEGALVQWLEQILANVLTDAVRRERAQKRDVALEQSLDAVLNESSTRLRGYLAADEASPSEQAERHEQLLRLAAALDQLPEDYRDVIIQRDLLAAPVEQIATQMGRTARSVAGLLLRARRKLRELLAEPQ
jgi:RNA polymerase sigma-70 factor (ECF subfamily)